MSRIYPTNIGQQLTTAVSPETAYVVADYPYGFKLRTSIRYWIEGNARKGYRNVSQTLSPKTGAWNKPKASTYSPLLAQYLESDTGYVKFAAWSGCDGEEGLVEFLKQFELSAEQRAQAELFLKLYAKRREGAQA